jgi:hypothetical protein
VTPTGEVVLEDGQRFNQFGREMGNDNYDNYHNAHLTTAADVEARNASQTAQTEKNRRFREAQAEIIAEMQGCKDEFGDYVGELTAERKAALVAIINAL